MRVLNVLIIAACTAVTAFPAAAQQAKSGIFFICDGMGPAQITAARIYKNNARDGELHLDAINDVGLVRTYALNGMVTDSAASATAYAAGEKVNNGVISLDPDGNPAETLLEQAKKAGKSVGVVSTARITHATPACFYAHVNVRAKEREIAAQLIDSSDVDVVLGGGKEYFLPDTVEDGESRSNGERDDGRNLIEEADGKGYTVIQSLENFNVIKDRVEAGQGPDKLLGLFSMSHMSYEATRNNDAWGEPSLAAMTDLAIAMLSRNPNGFFLMVEGARVDHACHQNEALKAITDLIAFDDAVGVGLDWVREHPDTFLAATADHETGGLAINGYAPLEISGDELLAAPSQRGRGDILTFSTGPGARREQYEDLSATDPEYAQPALRFMGSAAHSGVDINAYGAGAGAGLVAGTLDNTELNTIFRKVLGFPVE